MSVWKSNKNKYLSEIFWGISVLYRNHPFSVNDSIRRFEPAKIVKIVYEKPCRTDDMYENSEIDDFRTLDGLIFLALQTGL